MIFYEARFGLNRSFKILDVSRIEHVVSPVPIKCELELQTAEILTENFDTEDKIQGSDTSRVLYSEHLSELYFCFLDTLDAIGKLQTSSLELTVTPSSDDTRFIIGEWAEVKVIPTDIEFYSDFR